MPTDENESNPPSEPEPRCTSGVALSLCDEGERLSGAALSWLIQKSGEALEAMALSGELSVRVVGDDEMASAHQTYRGVEGTTDVLTFDLSGGGDGLDADLLICADEAQRQGQQRGHTTERELLLYIIHGVLHCTGHDDGESPQAEVMHAAEDEILASIGVDATYAAPGAQERQA